MHGSDEVGTRFSIVIPTYNRGQLIRKTIDSVLAQTFTAFEIIVVDDGSTDNTTNIVLGVGDHRIKYYKIVNSERAAARNFGINKAKGDYITFLDSDDLLRPNHFSEAAAFLSVNSNAEVFSLGYDIVTEAGAIENAWVPLPNPVNQKLIEGNFLSCMGVFVKNQVLKQNLFNEDRAMSGSEDYELWLRLAARFPIYTHPVSTAMLVNHHARSVVTTSPEKLMIRIQKIKECLVADSQVCAYFGNQLNTIKAYLDLYLSLHLAMDSFRILAIRTLFSVFVQKPSVVANYRFWVVIKKILIS